MHRTDSELMPFALSLLPNGKSSHSGINNDVKNVTELN